jgi:hypothetical protein
MMRSTRILVASTLVLTLHVAAARGADEYKLEPLAEAAPTEGVAPEIAGLLAPAGFKVVKGTSRTLCSFWPVKQLATKADFKPTAAVQYPLEMGQLVGVMHYKRAGEDFRGQEIAEGTYTVRYALQPEDGNHVGTSDTRDFFLLLKAADDKMPALVKKEDLFKLSAAAAGTAHPCMLSLLTAAGTTGEPPSLEHNEERELWSAAFAVKTDKGNGTLPIRVVVVGKAAE